MKILSQNVAIGDLLVWDTTVTNAEPAEVLAVEHTDRHVRITYRNRNGQSETYDYEWDEMLNTILK